MPTETIYVDMGKGAHKFARGIVTSAEILAMGRQQAADEDATRKVKYYLYDSSDVTETRVTPETLAMLVEINRKTAEISRGALSALVVPSELSYGLARVWQSLAQDIGWRVQIFRSRPEAILWLRTHLGDGDPNSPLLDAYPSLKMEE